VDLLGWLVLMTFCLLPMSTSDVVFGPEKIIRHRNRSIFVEGNEPPLLLLYGNDERYCEGVQYRSLTKKVKQAGGCVETHYYDGLDHAGLIGALALPLQKAHRYLAISPAFLDRHAMINAAVDKITCKFRL